MDEETVREHYGLQERLLEESDRRVAEADRRVETVKSNCEQMIREHEDMLKARVDVRDSVKTRLAVADSKRSRACDKYNAKRAEVKSRINKRNYQWNMAAKHHARYLAIQSEIVAAQMVEYNKNATPAERAAAQRHIADLKGQAEQQLKFMDDRINAASKEEAKIEPAKRAEEEFKKTMEECEKLYKDTEELLRREEDLVRESENNLSTAKDRGANECQTAVAAREAEVTRLNERRSIAERVKENLQRIINIMHDYNNK